MHARRITRKNLIHGLVNMNMKFQKIFIFTFVLLTNLFCLAGPINPPQPLPPPPPPVSINNTLLLLILSIVIGYFFTIVRANRNEVLQ